MELLRVKLLASAWTVSGLQSSINFSSIDDGYETEVDLYEGKYRFKQ